MNKREPGFSLVEVLVSLVIIGVSMAAFLHSAEVGTSSTVLLRDKMIAQLAGWNRLTDIENPNRISGIDAPFDVEEIINATPVDNIKKVVVTVSFNRRKLTQLTRFVYVPEKK